MDPRSRQRFPHSHFPLIASAIRTSPGSHSRNNARGLGGEHPAGASPCHTAERPSRSPDRPRLTTDDRRQLSNRSREPSSRMRKRILLEAGGTVQTSGPPAFYRAIGLALI